jgi:hypothetical protein
MANVYAIAYGNGTFVAVGDGHQLQTLSQTSNNIYVSNDGLSWSATDSGVSEAAAQSLGDVAFGNGRYVAVDSGGHIYSTANPFVWTRMTNNLAGANVSFCNGRFFIPAGPGTNLISADGVNWSAMTNSTGSTFGHVISAAGLYIAIGGTNVFSSFDGTNWTKRGFQQPSNVTLNDLVSGDRNVVLTGYASPSTPTIKPVAYTSDPLISLSVGTNFPPQLAISGVTGRTYRVEGRIDSISGSWQVLTNLTLTNGPIIWTDNDATNGCRLYRAAIVP